MKTQTGIKITVGAVIILLSISGVFLLFGYKQEKLNDAFLDAVEKGDIRKVTELLEQGADIHAVKRKYDSGDMAIHLAARKGDLDIVKFLLDKGISVDEENLDKITPLIKGLWNEKLAENDELIKYLIERGANVNHKDNLKRSPIHYIANSWHPDELINVVELLIKAGADLNAQDYYGMTPMQLALRREQYGMVEYLISKGAKVTIDVAAVLGNLDAVKKLVQDGENPFVKDRGGRTALDWAAQQGRFEVVRFLIEDYPKMRFQGETIENQEIERVLIYSIKTAHVDLMNYLVGIINDKYPDLKASYTRHLLLSVKSGKTEIVQMLLDNGADINARFSESLIEAAIDANNEETLRLLLSRGTNPNEEMKLLKITPLHQCAIYNRPKMVPILVEFGAKVDAKNMDGDEPLDLAARNDEAEVVQELIKAGAKISLWNAVRIGDIEKVKEFLQNKPDTNYIDKKGYAPIHLAVMAEKKDMVEFLLKEGADVNLPTPDNLTALDIAEGMYYKVFMVKERVKTIDEMSAILRQHGAKNYRDIKRK